MAGFKEIYDFMHEYGMFEFFFPWLFFTAIIYGILQSREYISSQTSVNGAIAISLAFLISYFGRGIFLANLFWIFSVFLILFFLALIVGGMFGVDVKKLFAEKSFIIYVGLGITFVSLISSLIVTNSFGYFGLDRFSFDGFADTLGLVVILAGLFGIFYVIVRE